MIDVDALAASTAGMVKGYVRRRELAEVIAAALTLAVNRTLTEIAEALEKERLLARLEVAGQGRRLPVWARRALRDELAALTDRLRHLRPRLCPRPAERRLGGATRS